nr:immunoglobulin light chain junction region [Macaca mulatta]MOV94337.1 immunoglobulin light chain junction region [Macaca mulatta]MOV94363.1 immunoglobulin light chain junction region [Macaca mulatta]MOV94478.1 immunoglobulin light chain junction region [Macaca mulatta]MOV94529.1 immunoglobulin light chain junction region [Macaca mulatta]
DYYCQVFDADTRVF